MSPRTIAGGFVLVPVASLLAAWHACRSRPLRPADFRTWLAAREMLARRNGGGSRRDAVARGGPATDPGRTPSYSAPELAGLLGVAGKSARASASRLVAAGLLEWSGSTIGFPDPAIEPEELASDTIGGGRGVVAIPRRMLRLLARGARPALVATALGLLLRCLSRRRSGWDGRGRAKASWIADLFDVDLRRVKAARKELVALGWIEPDPGDQWAENRWGRAYRIDLAWRRPVAGDGPRLPPPPARDGRRLPPPESDPEPLRGEENQELAGREPAGVEARGPGAGTGTRAAGPPAAPAGARGVPAPSLADVRAEDLEDAGRLLELHRQAVARGLVTASEADRLRFVAASEHARAIGRGNPPGLFASLVRGRRWRYLTQRDEDRANARIKAHLRGPAPRAMPSAARPGPGISDDARIVREVRSATIRAGIFRDPFPTFRARAPGWDRARWDAALAELGLI